MRPARLSAAFLAPLLAAAPVQAATVSTHMLDLARGVGGAGVPVVLEVQETAANAPDSAVAWRTVGRATTDANGRVRAFPGDPQLAPGTYRLRFDMTAYPAPGATPFFPEIDVIFRLGDAPHYHVPLVVSPYGYSTYRGN